MLPLGDSATAEPKFTPSILNCTDPVGAVAPVAGLTVAVNVMACPNVDGLADELTDVEVAVAPLNVTVSAGLAPKTALQGLVVPVHVEELRLAGALQPPNVEPPVALALNVTVAPLSDVVMLGEHVPLTVCELAFVPVPPHDRGALTVPVLGVMVTVPVPVPANVKFKFLASVKVVCAVSPEVNPLAPTRNFMFKS